MIYGYVRVSTDKQSFENQRFEISRFAAEQNLQVDKWIEETVSGTRKAEDRKLGRLLKKLRRNDMLISAEISRLGRNLLMIMGILNYCMTKGVRVWTVKDNYRLGPDINSKVLAFAFGLSAEIERNLISQRTREALARKKAEGIKLGRPLGRRNRTSKLTGFHQSIQLWRSEGVSIAEIARRCSVHRNTVTRLLSFREKRK